MPPAGPSSTLAPVIAAETIHARSAEIAFNMQQLPQASVLQHFLDFLQRRLKTPVEADRERQLALGTGAPRRLGAFPGQCEWLFGEHVLACRGRGDDLFGMKRMRGWKHTG